MKKTPERMTERIHFRVTENERRAIEYFADMESKKVSSYVREALYEKLERTINDVRPEN